MRLSRRYFVRDIIGPMKNVSIIVAIALLVLIALTLVPAASGYRFAFSVVALAAAVGLLVTLFTGRQSTAVPPLPVESIKHAPAPSAQAPSALVASNQAEAEVVSLLATLQQNGRLVDFLMDDISGYSDAEVGAVARVVQEGCKAVLLEQFRILPVREESEGSTVTVSAGYRADEYRLVGKLSGQAPFSGTLMHRGWKTESVKLPRVLRSADRFPTIAPAEVELK
jgi:hypothetical protein